MRFGFIGAALSTILLAGSACAQDVATNFATALSIFAPTGDPSEHLPPEGAADLIRRIEGTWLQADFLFSDGAYDATLAEEWCGRRVIEIGRTGIFNFTLTQIPEGEPSEAVVTYSWVGGMTFSRSANMDGQLEALFGDDWQNRPSAMWANAFRVPSLHGYGIVHLIGEDVLVIEDVASRPQILTRCPVN